jgi:sigma-B regulation protein RsbU (phosphoserine phosphatase)
MYYAPLTTTGWSLAVVAPDDELFAELSAYTQKVTGFSLAGLFILFLVIIVVTHQITRPLRFLAKAATAVGAGNFSTPIPIPDRGDEIGVLAQSFSAMQKALSQYIDNLKTTTAAKERIEGELNVAREIQLSIIPKFFPPFPHCPEFDLFAILESARAVGGDLYDFFFLDAEHLYFAVGDVSGKGVPASLFMAVSQTLARAKAEKGLSATEIAVKINRELCKDNHLCMFVTYFLAILNIKTGAMEFCNAGHNSPLLVRAGDQAVQELESDHGVPFGVFADAEYHSDTLTLRPGDRIVVYTDGVTEAMDAKLEQFGEDRFRAVVAAQPNQTAKELTQTIVTAVKEFVAGHEQSDDITVLVLNFHGEAGKAPPG